MVTSRTMSANEADTDATFILPTITESDSHSVQIALSTTSLSQEVALPSNIHVKTPIGMLFKCVVKFTFQFEVELSL